MGVLYFQGAMCEWGDLVGDLPKRKNHRLKDFDYGAYGYYYVTICTRNRKCLLSTISVGSDALVAPVDALVAPSITPAKLGERVTECFNNIAIMNENIEIDKFVLMPNHIHAIIIIKNEEPIEKTDKKYAFEIAERRGRRSLQGLIWCCLPFFVCHIFFAHKTAKAEQ